MTQSLFDMTSFSACNSKKNIATTSYVNTFTYNPYQQRIKTVYKENNLTLKTKYFIGDYECEVGLLGTKELFYVPTPSGATIIEVKTTSYISGSTTTDSIYYILKDHLGNYDVVVNQQGIVRERYSFDAWGNRRLATNWKTKDLSTTRLFDRGFTGHEHLDKFELINMNGRLYDPVLGRFLSPDNYVADNTFTQDFNRYTYARNNPLSYTDPDGEFIFTIFNAVKDFVVNTFGKVWTQGFNAWSNSENWHSTSMAWKIESGLFRGTVGQILSRFTWELPQTIIGYLFAGIQSTFYAVRRVDYYDGATVINSSWLKGGQGVTIGSFITGGKNIAADPNNSLFQHEYGHYLQSQASGLAYLSRYAIPSLLGAMGDNQHDFQVYEQDANLRAFKYFNKNVEGFYQTKEEYEYNKANGIRKGWNFASNPLDTYHKLYREYYDYHNSTQMDLLNTLLSLNPAWYEYTGEFILLGIYNHIYNNSHRP